MAVSDYLLTDSLYNYMRSTAH